MKNKSLQRLELIRFWGTPFRVVSQVLKQNQERFMLGAVSLHGKPGVITDHVWIKKIPGFEYENGDPFDEFVMVHRYGKGYGLELSRFPNNEI